MKKSYKILAVVLVVVMALGFAGCGSSRGGSSAASQASYDSGYGYNSYAAAEDSYYDAAEAAEYETPAAAPTASAPGGLNAANARVEGSAEITDMSEKIIYNADITLETTSFDDALERIADMVSQMGGYLESSSISGSNYASISRGSAGARSASYTIRIPAARFNDMTGSISDLGNVPYSSTYTRNVTTQYYDTRSRLDAYRVQETRLLEMLAIAETVEDMLAIQRELTEVQYEIDSLTGTLRYYDNQVGYSTIYLTVREVREYTPEPTITLSYWERMSKEFRQSVSATANFFKEFFLWFVTSLPWLIPLCLVIWALVALLRRRAAKNPQRAAARQARREAKLAVKEARRAAKAARKLPPGAGSDSAPENGGEDR